MWLPTVLLSSLASTCLSIASWCPWRFDDCRPSPLDSSRCVAVELRQCRCPADPVTCPGESIQHVEAPQLCIQRPNCPIRGQWCPWEDCDPKINRRRRYKCCRPDGGRFPLRVICDPKETMKHALCPNATAVPTDSVLAWETGGGVILVIIGVILVIRLVVAQRRILARAWRAVCDRDWCRRRPAPVWSTLPDSEEPAETSFVAPDAFPNPALLTDDIGEPVSA